MDRRGDCAPASQACWSSLPGDIVLMIEEKLSAQSMTGHTASMRATCSSWRHALAAAPADLQPLGKPARLAAFPRAVSLDYAARGAGQALTDAELEAACRLLGRRLERLDVSGAFQLTAAGMSRALRACTALRLLAANGSTLQDAAFAVLHNPPPVAAVWQAAGASGASGSSSGGAAAAAVAFAAALARLTRPNISSSSSSSASASISPLLHLESLSLRGCLFLRGPGLLADLAVACPALSSLDLANCALALNLNPETAALLPRLAELRRLVLDGNQADDGAMHHIAALPLLRELSVRSSTHLTDAGLHELAHHRGSTAIPRSGGSSSIVDVGLVSLDISGCTGVTDQCWLAVTEMQGLTSLSMEHMGHLLQFAAMPEALPAALWRLPRLRHLSLAGSCCHPSKLKLLAATCGGSVTHLDIGTGGSSGGSTCCCCCCKGGGAVQPAAAVQLAPAGPAYRRLTSLHERDLCEAAQSFKQLQSFSAAGSGLPLRVCSAFLEAVPAGRLARADLSGCCLEAESPVVAAAHAAQAPWQQQAFFSSGARRALHFDSYPAVTGSSASRLQQLHAEDDSWQRPPTAGRFAAALRRQAPSLASLRLGGASGVTDRHLSSLRALSALTHLCLAGVGAGGAVSAALLAEAVASCTRLRQLDLSSTAADNACLAAAAGALPRLSCLAAARCGGVGGAGVAALAAGPAAATLRWLDLSGTAVDDVAAAELAARCPNLRGLLLSGCRSLTAAGVEQLCQLSRLTCLVLGRCPHAVTDASLRLLARHLPLLTRLGLADAGHLTAAGLAAALPLLPCLADLDLTCCWQLRDDHLLQLLTGQGSSSSGSDAVIGGSGSSSRSSSSGGGSAPATPANVQLPQGGSSPTGSPFRRRASALA